MQYSIFINNNAAQGTSVLARRILLYMFQFTEISQQEK
jgi:hypothetical protein